MAVKYHIRLSSDEQKELQRIIKNPKIAKYKRDHAQILIALNESGNGPYLKADEIAKVCVISTRTVERVRKRCVEEGTEAAVYSKFGSHGRPRRLDGEQQAHLVALTCSEPLEGTKRWTLQLLADQMIQLKYVDNISRTTISRELKKMNLNHGGARSGAFPPKRMLSL